MTLPYERTIALSNTRWFLQILIDPKKTPRVPRKIRIHARWCLKHFPTELDIECAAKTAKKVFGKYYNKRK